MLLSLLVGCQKEAEEDTIKIGFFGAPSGEQAVWGQADRDGLILTVEQINEAGGILGKQVELVTYDDKGDQLEAVNVVKRLINEDKVVAIIGCSSSGRDIAVAPVAEEGKVPVISTFGTNPRVTVPEEGKSMKYTFRVWFIDPYSGQVTAKFAWNDLGARKAAVLYEISSDYSVGSATFSSSRGNNWEARSWRMRPSRPGCGLPRAAHHDQRGGAGRDCYALPV